MQTESPRLADIDRPGFRMRELPLPMFLGCANFADEQLPNYVSGWQLFIDDGLGQHLITKCQNAINEAKAQLRHSADRLIANELALIDNFRHPIELAVRDRGMKWVPFADAIETSSTCPDSMYRVLALVLRMKRIESVFCLGNADYKVLRLAASERLRRELSGKETWIRGGFAISAWDRNKRWARVAEIFEFTGQHIRAHSAPAWIHWVNFCHGALDNEEDYRDLFAHYFHDLIVDVPPVHPEFPLSAILDAYPGDDVYPSPKVVISLVEPDIATSGFEWFRQRDGFSVGVTGNESQRPIREALRELRCWSDILPV